MDINIKKVNMEEEKTEDWDMPVSGRVGEVQLPKSDFKNPRSRTSTKSENFSISEISSQPPKMLFYWQAISRWALIALAALAPIFFLPFTSLPVAVHKEVLVFTLILIALFALFGKILVEGRIRYPGHLLAVALAILVVVWGVSSFFSINQLGSLIGSWAAPVSFASIFLFAVLAFAAVATFSRRDIILSLLLFLASLALLGVFELLQLMKVFILPFAWARSALFNPIGSVNDLGVLLAFGLILAAGLMSSVDMSRLLKRALGAAVVVFLLSLMVIDFWAIWVGLALAMIFMISFLSAGVRPISDPPSSISETELQQGFTKSGDLDFVNHSSGQGLQLAYFQKAWLPTIVLLISLIFLFLPSPLSKFVQTPIEVSPNFKSTINIALDSFSARGGSAFGGRTLIGSGPSTFGNIYNLYKPVSINSTIFWATSFNAGASAMASWLGTVGVLGILALLFLIFAFIRTGISGTAVRDASRGVMNVASQSVFIGVSFLFLMWFLYVANFTTMAITFWGIGLFLASSLLFMMEKGFTKSGNLDFVNPFREIRIFNTPPKTFIFSLLIIGLMVGTAAGIYFESNRYIAELYLGKAVAESAKGNNAGTINQISKAIDFWPYDERYFQSMAQAVFFELNNLLSRTDLPQAELQAQFQNIINQSTGAAKAAKDLNPKNPFNSFLSGNIYENLIQFIPNAADFALSEYAAAISLDPKNPVNYVALARILVAKKELDKAAANLEEAINLKADYAPARFILVQIYDQQGKMPEAIKRAEELVMLNNTDTGALFQLGFLYYKAGRYDDSKIVFERTVELSPNYSNARYFLGLIYDGSTSLTIGDKKAKALEQFAKIAELNPDNNEVKQIIANLKAKKPALLGIAPPAPAPQNRAEVPVSEKAPVQKLKK